MTADHEWTLAEPRALARFVNARDLVAPLTFPADLSRVDTYASGGASAVAAEIYQAIVGAGLQYELAPFDTRSGVVQRIRKPATILAAKRATCLDLAVLFATACLAQDLLSFVVLLEGHALAGFSRTRSRRDARRGPLWAAWDRGLLSDLEAATELVAGDLQLVECTGMAACASLDDAFPEGRGRGAEGRLTFQRACVAGAEQILMHAQPAGGVPVPGQRRFLCVLDVHDLQTAQGFTPTETPDVPETRGESGFRLSVGRDMKVKGDLVVGDQVKHSGDTITIGSISGNDNTLAIGRGAQAFSYRGSGLSEVFNAARQLITIRPDSPTISKDELKQTVGWIEQETVQAEGQAATPNENKVARWVGTLVDSAPDVLDVIVAGLGNPLGGAALALKKIIERVRASRA